MIPVKVLELQMSAVIRAGLRKAMRHIDVTNPKDPLHEVEQALEAILYDPLHDQILKTYSEGYTAAGNLIRRHIRVAAIDDPIWAAGMKAAASPLGTTIVHEDPRIAKATKAVIYGLKDSLGGHRNEIQAALRVQYEKGASIPNIARRLEGFFDADRVASTRFARTVTNDVYNRAHLDRYEQSGMVDGVQYSAHLDDRTSDICEMLNGTIWALNDSDIVVPPAHFSCRSRLVPYFGKIPGARDFEKKFGSDFVERAKKTSAVFRKKYWTPMPHTKASATLQRSYFHKSDIKVIDRGLTLAIREERKRVMPDVASLDRLKSTLRYRKIDPDTTIIADRFGKSLMLDKFEERDIVKAIKLLISQTDTRITKEIAKRQKEINAAWKEVLHTRKAIEHAKDNIRHKKKLLSTDPAHAVEYHQEITRIQKYLAKHRLAEQRRLNEWNQLIDLKPSPKRVSFEIDKEKYETMLDSFKFRRSP